MNDIKLIAKSVLEMDKQLRQELFIKDGKTDEKKLWENTYIKKQIDKRNKGDIFTVSDHIRGMVYSMLTSGASWYRTEPYIDIDTGRITVIDEIFCQYDVDTLLNTDPMTLVDKVKSYKLGTQYIKNQMVALVNDNIAKLIAIEKEYGNIDVLYKQFISSDPTMKTIVKELSTAGKPYKFVQLGGALTAEYLKNVGYSVGKPDRHIRRIFGSNYLACSNKNEAGIDESIDIINDIAKELNKSAAEVDYILWSYCANGFGNICTKNKANHNKCVAADICNYIAEGVDG